MCIHNHSVDCQWPFEVADNELSLILYPIFESQTICWHGWDDNACLGVRNTRIRAWPNFLVWSPPWYCVVSPLLQTHLSGWIYIHGFPLKNQLTVCTTRAQHGNSYQLILKKRTMISPGRQSDNFTNFHMRYWSSYNSAI